MARSEGSRSGSLAFTLVEVLIAVAVLAVLAAILLPIVERARVEARRTSVLSNLRQIGQAMEIYQQTYEGRAPRYATELVSAKLLPAALLASPFDPIARGLANYNRSISPELGRPLTPYKDSVLVLEEHVGPSLVPAVSESKGAGWAVSIVDRLPTFADPSLGESNVYVTSIVGRYYRLCFDGSVVSRRTMVKSRAARTGLETYTSLTWLFTDDTDGFD